MGDLSGLTPAIGEPFQGASWEHCQRYLTRNCCRTPQLRFVPQRRRWQACAAGAGQMEAVRRLTDFCERFAKAHARRWLRACDAVVALTEKYRKRLRSTNMQKRLDEETRHRERVIRIFPNGDPALLAPYWPNITKPGKNESIWKNSGRGPQHPPLVRQ